MAAEHGLFILKYTISLLFANGPDRFTESNRINAILMDQYEDRKDIIEMDKKEKEAHLQKVRFKRALREKQLMEQRK